MTYDTIGDRMKAYEAPSIDRIAFKGQPLIVRLDGKSFHTFCKGLARPYDSRLSELMKRLMVELVDRFNAKIGYTQSDEITLAWNIAPDSSSDFPYMGRFQKMESLIAGYASAWFSVELMRGAIDEKSGYVAHFDARAYVVPNLLEAYHVFLWRQQDAVKNAISMAAQSMFSHKELQGLHGPQMQEKMWAECGVNFNDYPSYFKRGVFARRIKTERELTAEQLSKIAPKHRPTGPISRSCVDSVDIWLAKQESGVDVLFNDAAIKRAPDEAIPTGTKYDDRFGTKETFERFGLIGKELGL